MTLSQESKGKGFSLANYPIILFSLLASCLDTQLDLLNELDNYKNDDFWLTLLLRSSAKGLEILSKKDNSILRIKELNSQKIKILSAYSILDK